MDALVSVFQTVRVGSVRMVEIEGARPWSLRVEQTEGGAFHWIARGSAVLSVDGLAPASIEGTRGIVLPHGHPHSLYDGTSTAASLMELLSRSGLGAAHRLGRGAPCATLISGVFRIDASCEHPLMAGLPAVLPLDAEETRGLAWLGQGLRSAVCQLAPADAEEQAIRNHLADVLLIRSMGSYLRASSGDGRARLLASVDPHVGAALRLIHEQPTEPWTVAGLAARVGMSRSAFASRFAEVVAEPPGHYITRSKLRRAALLLRSSALGIAEVASRVGYSSEAAFSKAFKRWSGAPPSAYRRTTR
jgi:AraC-like DNA-binding protein